MRITFLIGNGFDLNLGMQTRFKDFCAHIKKENTDSDNEIIKTIKDEPIELWSDMERRLGQYCNSDNVKDERRYLDEKLNLEQELEKYLEAQQKPVIEKIKKEPKIYADEFIRSVKAFQNIFPQKDKNVIANLISQFNTSIDYTFISFNYTEVLDAIFKAARETVGDALSHVCTSTNTKYTDRLTETYHVHGSLHDGIILGVNDAGQIAMKVENKSAIAVNMVKRLSNNEYGELRTENTTRLINESRLICLYGMSIGETDAMWWNAVCSRLSQDPACRLVIFVHTDKSDRYIVNRQQINYDTKEKLRRNSRIKDEIWNAIEGRIIVKANPEIFQFRT